MKYRHLLLISTKHFKARAYQEPHRVGLSFGIDISNKGWKNPLFHIRVLIWEIDLEIDYSDPKKLSEFDYLIKSIREGEIEREISVNS